MNAATDYSQSDNWLYITTYNIGKGGFVMEEKQNMFRKTAIDRMRGPEDLNEYIKVTTPSAWLLLAAVGILLAGLFAWIVLGSVEVVSANGIAEQIRPIEWVFGK